jgi:hypothetical protein
MFQLAADYERKAKLAEALETSLQMPSDQNAPLPKIFEAFLTASKDYDSRNGRARQHARDCAELARSTVDPHLQHSFLELEKQWLEHAKKAERKPLWRRICLWLPAQPVDATHALNRLDPRPSRQPTPPGIDHSRHCG